MLVKRLFATTTGALLSKGAAIITALLLFRQLPAADMGRYTAALTLVSFCAILANAGLNPLTTREVARRGRDAPPFGERPLREPGSRALAFGSRAASWWIAIAPLRLLLALAAYALLVVVALFIPGLVDARLALVAGLLLVPDALSAMLAATLNGLGRATLASWLDALSNLIGLFATLALVLLWHADIFALAWLAVALAGIAFALNSLALLKSWQLRPALAIKIAEGGVPEEGLGGRRPLGANLFAGGGGGEPSPGADVPSGCAISTAGTREMWRQALMAALPLGLGALAATLYFRVDTLFLSAARGGQAVAYYSAPYQIVESFWLISTSWNAIALPALARRYSPRFVERSVALLLSIGLPASLLIAFRAEDVTRLVFGQDYLPAALPLRWVIWVVPILFGYVPVVTALFVHDRQGRVLLVLLSNLALALLLDALLIPSSGALGASIATVIVEAGALAGYLWLAHRARLGIKWARGLYQPALLCIPLTGLLVIGRGLPFPLLLTLTLLLWAALFWLLRPWTTPPLGANVRQLFNHNNALPTEANGQEPPAYARDASLVAVGGVPEAGLGGRRPIAAILSRQARRAIGYAGYIKTPSTAGAPEEVNTR